MGSSAFGEDALGPCWGRDMDLTMCWVQGWSGTVQVVTWVTETPKEMGSLGERTRCLTPSLTGLNFPSHQALNFEARVSDLGKRPPGFQL